MTKKNNFISAIATGANLNDLAKIDSKDKEQIKNIEEVKKNEDVKVQDIEAPADEIKQETVSTKPEPKKSKSKNNKEFIEKIIALHNEKKEITNEKTSLLVTPKLHYKLKMLAFSSKVNLFDLTNAIFTSFLEENSEDIEALMKKMM